MKKYLALYMIPASTVKKLMKTTPEQAKAGMEEWTRWAKKNAKAIVDLGTPLGRTKCIAMAGVSDTRNQITGFTVVQGRSWESVVKAFKGHPHLQLAGASIDLIESFEIPGA